MLADHINPRRVPLLSAGSWEPCARGKADRELGRVGELESGPALPCHFILSPDNLTHLPSQGPPVSHPGAGSSRHDGHVELKSRAEAPQKSQNCLTAGGRGKNVK